MAKFWHHYFWLILKVLYKGLFLAVFFSHIVLCLDLRVLLYLALVNPIANDYYKMRFFYRQQLTARLSNTSIGGRKTA